MFNIADLYSALRDYRDTIGHDLTSVRGQGIFDKHYAAANKDLAIARHPKTGKPYISYARSTIPYENKHTIEALHLDSSTIGGHPTTLEITHLMPLTKVAQGYGKNDGVHHLLADYGKYDTDNKLTMSMERLMNGMKHSKAEYIYPDPTNQPLDDEIIRIFGEHAPYAHAHEGGIHDVIKEMMQKPAIGGVDIRQLEGRNTSRDMRMMSSEEMQNYLNADNKLQQYTPSHLINVFGMNGNSNHVLNLDTEELHEGQVQPRKNWLL